MRKVGLLAFAATSLVLVPAVLHELTAGPQQIAKLVAPSASSFDLGNAHIDAKVDRSVVDPGAVVKVTLVASAAQTQKVTVDVLVFESIGSGGGRIEAPPNRVGRETVTLEAKAGGGPARDLTFQLSGAVRGSNIEGTDPFGRYTFLVMAPKSADKLERLRRRAKQVENGLNDPTGDHETFMSAYRALRPEEDVDDGEQTELGGPRTVARLEVTTRPKDSPVAIRAPETARVGDPFSVFVRVRNPLSEKLEGVSVSLELPSFGLGGRYIGLTSEEVEIKAPTGSFTLAPNQTKQVEFKVTAAKPGVLGLYALSMVGNMVGAGDGNLEAIDVVAAPAKPPVTAAR